MMQSAENIWTIGYASLSILKFITIIKKHAIQIVVDIRSFPDSGPPHAFYQLPLANALGLAGIGYFFLPSLGENRYPPGGVALQARSGPDLHAYTLYMGTAAFRQAIQRLLGRARSHSLVIMGKKSQWQDCHRSLVADYLHVAGIGVSHILDHDRSEPHILSKTAEVRDGVLRYLNEP